MWRMAFTVATPQKAALALIAAAEDPKGGKFYDAMDGNGKPAKQTRDELLQNFLWDDTARLLNLEWPIAGL